MSSSSNGKKKKKDTAAAESKDEQIDELLRAAQDDMLLKLSLNSHMARSSQFSGIDPDLESRFHALKKPHQPKSKPKSNLDAATTRIGGEKKNPDQSDDLFARFAALKGSLPSYSTSSSAASAVGIGNISDQVQQQQQVLMDDDNEEDEVEKVIKWAIDAARLDPSPPSDSDDDDHSDDHSDDEGDDTDNDRGVDAAKKSKRR